MEHLTRAKEQVREEEGVLAENRANERAMEVELEHKRLTRAAALEELRAHTSASSSPLTSRRHSHGGGANGAGIGGGGHERETAATVTGILAGAGGMLVFVVAVQWFTGRRSRQQVNVPVRYGLHHAQPISPTFFSVNKRL